MRYNFSCKNCGNTKIVEIPMGEKLPKVICEKCGKFMNQNFKDKVSSLGIEITEDFKATSEFKSKDYSKGSTPLEQTGINLNF